MAEALLELESDDIRRAVAIDTYMKDVAENYEEAVEAEVVFLIILDNLEYLKDTLSSAEARRVFFLGGVDPLSNVSAGTEAQAMAESAGASARYHTQDGRHPGETIFSKLLSGVACIPCATVKMAGKILRFSDV